MTNKNPQSIPTIGLGDAFAEAFKDDREREHVRRIAGSLAGAAGAPDLAGLYPDVLREWVSLAAATAVPVESGQRQLRHEMAVTVCKADGRLTDPQRRFLNGKMVYRTGKAHGVKLAYGHSKEFIAGVGVGRTPQSLEQFGHKLLGGRQGKVMGKAFGPVGGIATGMAFSHATTHAPGQVGRRCYAGGRTTNTLLLRDAFHNLPGPAKQKQTQYLPQIQQQAATLDASRIVAMMRGDRESIA